MKSQIENHYDYHNTHSLIPQVQFSNVIAPHKFCDTARSHKSLDALEAWLTSHHVTTENNEDATVQDFRSSGDPETGAQGRVQLYWNSHGRPQLLRQLEQDHDLTIQP
jgi:hypothetical protein